MHLSARHPAQRPASDWGRHTATPNTFKIGKLKPSFTDFHTLPTQYDEAKCMRATTKARRCAFWHVARPSVQWQRKVTTLSVFLGINSHSPLEVEGPAAPPPSSVLRTLAGARRSSSRTGVLLASITCKTNNGGRTPACTFVGTPHGCRFHPSKVDG